LFFSPAGEKSLVSQVDIFWDLITSAGRRLLLGKPFLQFGDAIFDADDLVHLLGGIVGAALIGTPRLAAFHAGKPRSQDGK
jgi:hypothetical protein